MLVSFGRVTQSDVSEKRVVVIRDIPTSARRLAVIIYAAPLCA